MQLTRKETVSAFWQGAKKGLLTSLGYIAAASVLIGGGIWLGLIPTTLIPVGAAILTAISTAVTVGMFSGHQSLSNYHQQKHNMLYEAKIARLEGQGMPPLAMEHDAIHPPSVTSVLKHGDRSERSFVQAEEDRAAAPTTRTLH